MTRSKSTAWDLDTVDRLIAVMRLHSNDAATAWPRMLADRLRTGRRKGLTDPERRIIWGACEAYGVPTITGDR